MSSLCWTLFLWAKTLLLLELCLCTFVQVTTPNCLGEVCMGREGSVQLGTVGDAEFSKGRKRVAAGLDRRPIPPLEHFVEAELLRRRRRTPPREMFYGSNVTAGRAPDLTPMMSPANSETLKPMYRGICGSIRFCSCGPSASKISSGFRASLSLPLVYPQLEVHFLRFSFVASVLSPIFSRFFVRSCPWSSLGLLDSSIANEPLGRLFHMKLPRFLKRRWLAPHPWYCSN